MSLGVLMKYFYISRPPRSPVEDQLASLNDLLEEALRTDSVSDVTSCDNSTDSLDVLPRPLQLPPQKIKIRSASDSGTESLISEHDGYVSTGRHLTLSWPP